MATHNTRVLVIDDEEIACKRLKAVFEKHGYNVEIFEDSRLAMKRFSEQPFDVVVSDIRMDALDGLQVLEQVQQQSQQTKVILITGYATIEIARTAVAKGAFDCIAKPFNPNELLAVVEKASQALGVS